NLVTLLPFGVVLVFPIWLVGLMYLYDLDLWETRFLIFINWFLNTAVKTFVLVALLTMIMHGKIGHDWIGDHEDAAPLTETEKAEATIDELGGDIEHQPGDDDNPPVIGVSLAGTKVTDAQLAILKNFPRLRTLDLSQTRVSDAGLTHLK